MIRILKVGGSLFDLPDLGPRLKEVLAALPPATNVLLAGGGKIADAAAAMQTTHHLTEEATHWLCISALSTSSKILKTLLPIARLTHDTRDIKEAAPPSLWILDSEQLLRRSDSHQVVTSLPQNASVTTDSIAAAVAVELAASELLLLKSTDWPEEPTASRSKLLEMAAKGGLVDLHFPIVAKFVAKVGWVNLRAGRKLIWV
jgi:5-(aminomethyl)-3-furanmethanol phosphate kinase